MMVELLAENQFGANGPQKGDLLDVFSFRHDEDGDIWFFAWDHQRFPGNTMYFAVAEYMVRAVER